MKKLFASFALTASLFSVIASAETGTVHSIIQQSDGQVMVCVNTGAANPACAVLKGGVDSVKTMTAMAMTAKASGNNILVRFNNGGWNFMQLQ